MKEQRPALGCLILVILGPLCAFTLGITLGVMGAIAWQGLVLGWTWAACLFH